MDKYHFDLNNPQIGSLDRSKIVLDPSEENNHGVVARQFQRRSQSSNSGRRKDAPATESGDRADTDKSQLVLDERQTSICSGCRKWMVDTGFLKRRNRYARKTEKPPAPKCPNECITQAIIDRLENMEKATLLSEEKLKKCTEIRGRMQASLDALRSIRYPPPTLRPTICLSRALSMGKDFGFTDEVYRCFEKVARESGIFPDDDSADQTGLAELDRAYNLFSDLERDLKEYYKVWKSL